MWTADWTFAHLTKLHKRQPGLVDTALQEMLETNPDLTWSLVVSAYLDEEINLGKAAEMLDMHELELRERFIELGIPLRIGPATVAEAQAEVQALNSWFSREEADSTL
jgi:predicted HTH domain antitoxin